MSGGDYAGEAASSVTVTVIENEVSVLSIADAAADEDAGTLTFAVTLSLAAGEAATVDYATVGGTATAGSDFTAASDTLTVPAGATAAEVTVPILDDDADEPDETFEVRLSNAAVATLTGGRAEATGTIRDDDVPQVTVWFAAEVYTATEGGAAGEVTARLDVVPERPLEIPLTARGEGGATETDWSEVPELLKFGANEREKRFRVRAANDGDDDDDESVVLGFGQPLPDGVSQGTPATATVTLVDDDHPPVDVWLTALGDTAAESGATAEVAVRLSAAPERAVDVPLVARGAGGATPADWNVPDALSFLPDETEARFAVRAVDDAGTTMARGSRSVSGGCRTG